MAHPLTSSPQLRDQIKVSYEFFTNEVDRLIITDETGAAGLHFLDWDGSQFIQAKYYPYLTNPRGIHIEHGTFAPPQSALGYGWSLDNLVVTPLPEPSTWALGGIGRRVALGSKAKGKSKKVKIKPRLGME